VVWLPVVLWTMVICHGVLLWIVGEHRGALLEVRLHVVLRKGGHFLGYGIFGYLWLRAFSATYPNGTRIIWPGLAIACTFLIASLDEWHQSFSPARTGHFGKESFSLAAAPEDERTRERRPGRHNAFVRNARFELCRRCGSVD
jgi:hypothetical protein